MDPSPLWEAWKSPPMLACRQGELPTLSAADTSEWYTLKPLFVFLMGVNVGYKNSMCVRVGFLLIMILVEAAGLIL